MQGPESKQFTPCQNVSTRFKKGEGIISLYLKDKICLIYALTGKNGQTIGITIMETIRQTATSPVPAFK